MKPCFFVTFLVLSILLPIFAKERVVCESNDGECQDAGDYCENSLGKQDCLDEQICCGPKPEMRGNRRWCPNTCDCIGIGGECEHKNKCKVVLNTTLCSNWSRKCVCCNRTCHEKEKKRCKNVDGTCTSFSECGEGEREIENGCRSSFCKCCAPACEPTNECEEAGGECVTGRWNCPYGVILPNGCKGRRCHCCLPVWKKVRNCKDLLNLGFSECGIYTIYPEGFPDGVKVYCDQATDQGGWTVFLQRKLESPQVLFNRTFEEYAEGFGDLNREFWLGNRILHALTADVNFTLRVEAKNYYNESRTATWGYFSLGCESTNFTLSIGDYNESSTLGDSLTNLNSGWPTTTNNMQFSTYDEDNTPEHRNCSGDYGMGGWWFNGCYGTNPTAPLGYVDEYSHACWLFWDNSIATSAFPSVYISEIQFKIVPN